MLSWGYADVNDEVFLLHCFGMDMLKVIMNLNHIYCSLTSFKRSVTNSSVIFPIWFLSDVVWKPCVDFGRTLIFLIRPLSQSQSDNQDSWPSSDTTMTTTTTSWRKTPATKTMSADTCGSFRTADSTASSPTSTLTPSTSTLSQSTSAWTSPQRIVTQRSHRTFDDPERKEMRLA